MNVGHVNGPGGVEPTPNRPERQQGTEARSHRHRDEAQISQVSQKALELERLAEEGADIRADRVEAARARLESGELDRPEVFRATAERLLEDS